MRYQEFEVAIGAGAEAGAGGRYPVEVTASPQGGVVRGSFSVPAETGSFRRLLCRLERAEATTAAAAATRTYGVALFEALFSGAVGESLAVARDRAERAGDRLRIRLRIEAPELAVVPWEYLRDPEQGAFLALSQRTPLVRSLALARPQPTLTISPPLRILAMVAAPSDQPRLEVAAERRWIEAALEPARQAGRVELKWLAGQTWRDLQRELRRSSPWHVFHFIGHGEVDSEAGEGLLALAGDDGATEWLGAGQLGDFLAGSDLRLVVLNACLGARPAIEEATVSSAATLVPLVSEALRQARRDDVFSSTAATLIRRGLAAVVAMQYRITDQAAIEFARTFYEAIADGAPVDAAVTDARQAIATAGQGAPIEWGTPVLYLNAADAIVFTTAAPPSVNRQQRQQPGGSARPVGSVPPVTAPLPLGAADRDSLVNLLSRLASTAPGRLPQDFLRDLVGRTELPETWRQQLAGIWSGNAPADVRRLLAWAQGKGTNPAQPQWTTLGSLLLPLLTDDDLGVEDRRTVIDLIQRYHLCTDPTLVPREG